MSDAYSDGFKARLRGEELKDNPHLPASPTWQLWQKGWTDQDRHLTERNEAFDSIGWFG